MPVKPSKNKGGRPRRLPDGERLERLTINLPPKLKYGLELLANGRKVSLSQALEWALGMGLNSHFPAGRRQGGPTLAAVLDDAWTAGAKYPMLRHMVVYERAQDLLDSETRITCELIASSTEWRLRGLDDDERDTLHVFIQTHWRELQAHALELDAAGRPLDGACLSEIVTKRPRPDLLHYLGEDGGKALRQELVNRLALA